MPDASTSPHARRRPAAPLGWFAFLSLLLHAGLLWYGQQPAPMSVHHTEHLAIQLVERRPAQQGAQKRPAPTAVVTAPRPAPVPDPQPHPVRTRPVPVQPAARRPAPATPERVEATTATAATEAEAIDTAARESSLRHSVQLELARHFHYPLLARKRGWQGEVLLAFRLEADGRISEARVARSSGYGVLDNAALTALGKIKRIKGGTVHGFAMQIPVIYHLEG